MNDDEIYEEASQPILSRLTVRNFKRFDEAVIELGNPVVFIGPNNSGKTTALQALALWEVGLKRWLEKRRNSKSRKRTGVSINRTDVLALPISSSKALWRDLRVRAVSKPDGKQQTENIRIEIIVEGISQGEEWVCGLEFDYANDQSFFVRPLKGASSKEDQPATVPEVAAKVSVAYLPPMSGLATNETRLDAGAINVRLGEGRTAEVLRNLCYQLAYSDLPDKRAMWKDICIQMNDLFGVAMDMPNYVRERGEITMTYKDPGGIQLDIASSGRGLQQILLLLTYMSLNSRSVILVDEPDAHLEFIRQREIYALLAETARNTDSQLIAASHSEIVLGEAVDRDVVVAFVGSPHRIDDRGAQLRKALKEIGYDQFAQAEQLGWVLYLEGSTDLAILRALAEVLDHPARECLKRPFVRYVQNQPQQARHHFFGLREAKPDLVGFFLFDNIIDEMRCGNGLTERMWSRREIENYICQEAALKAWALSEGLRVSGGPLFSATWVATMETSIEEIAKAMEQLGKPSPWSSNVKASDDFLDPLFRDFFRRMGLPNLMRKTDYHTLAHFMVADDVDGEVASRLDEISDTASRAAPRA